MEGERLIELAREHCIHYHQEQFRKGNNMPYHTHPMAVAQLLDRYGYSDYVTQCVALLHDTVEDTDLIMKEIKGRFGYEVANGIYVMSKNTIKDETMDLANRILKIEGITKEQFYKIRLLAARDSTQRVKIADTIDNTKDLFSLKPEGRERKVRDSEELYIPLGRRIAPLMVKELEQNLDNYRTLVGLRA